MSRCWTKPSSSDAFGGPSPPVFYHGVECTLEGKKQGDVLCDGSIYQPHACTAREWLHNGHCIPLFCSRSVHAREELLPLQLMPRDGSRYPDGS